MFIGLMICKSFSGFMKFYNKTRKALFLMLYNYKNIFIFYTSNFAGRPSERVLFYLFLVLLLLYMLKFFVKLQHFLFSLLVEFSHVSFAFRLSNLHVVQ